MDCQTGPGLTAELKTAPRMVNVMVCEDDPPQVFLLKTEACHEPQNGPMATRVTRVDDRKPLGPAQQVGLGQPQAGNHMDHRHRSTTDQISRTPSLPCWERLRSDDIDSSRKRQHTNVDNLSA